jgi:hypothetical protein
LVQSTTIGFGLDGSAILTVRPKREQVGQSLVQVTVNDGKSTVSRSFTLTVFDPSGPPVLGTIPNQTTTKNQSVIVTVPVTDPDTPVSELTTTAVVSNTSVLKPIAFSNDGATIKALIAPIANATGTSSVTITVSDGTGSASTSFTVTVNETQAPQAPVLGTIPNQTMAKNESTIIVVPVSDSDTPTADLTFTAMVSNTSVLKPIAFSNDGTTVKALIAPKNDATGSSSVTIMVSDGTSNSSTSFTVTVGGAQGPELATPSVKVNPDGTISITVTWTGGGELEVADSPAGPWSGTGNTSGTFTEVATKAAHFYRVRQNN